MPWTNLPYVVGDSWQPQAAYNELVDAINERIAEASIPIAPLDYVSVDDEWPSNLGPIRLLQVAVDAIAGYFVDHTQTAVSVADGPYSGSPVMFNAGTAKAAAGLSPGLRRRRDRTITSLGDAGTDGWKARLASSGNMTKDVAVRAGGVWTITPGAVADVLETNGTSGISDHIGKDDHIDGHLFNDLMAVVNVLLWLGPVSVGTPWPTLIGDMWEGSGASTPSMSVPGAAEFAEAQANATADWTSGVETVARNNPHALSNFTSDVGAVVTPPYTAFAFLSRRIYRLYKPTVDGSQYMIWGLVDVPDPGLDSTGFDNGDEDPFGDPLTPVAWAPLYEGVPDGGTTMPDVGTVDPDGNPPAHNTWAGQQNTGASYGWSMSQTVEFRKPAWTYA